MKYIKEMEIKYVMEYSKHNKYISYFYDPDNCVWNQNNINVVKTFDNIFLSHNNKSFLMTTIKKYVSDEDLYTKMGIPRKLGLLFYGLPGNGKSSTIYAISKEYNRPIYKINLNVPKNKFINQIHSVERGSIVVFEDIDTYHVSHNRLNSSDDKNKDKSNSEKIIMADILEILDGYCFLLDCIIIMTTNHIDKLDSALIRSGRMDHKIEFLNAEPNQIQEIIKYFYGEKLDQTLINKIHQKNLSVSELINTHIIPNLDNLDFLIKSLT